jgi:hypothetical protein
MTFMSLIASCACERYTSLTSACRVIRQPTAAARFSAPGPSAVQDLAASQGSQ